MAPDNTVDSTTVPAAVRPSEVGPVVIKVIVRVSVKTPSAVVHDLVNTLPSVTGVGLVNEITSPLTKPVLSLRMLVTISGAPDVIEVAVVTSPVLAVRVPVGTKLKAVVIAAAEAGEAPNAITAMIPPTANELRKLWKPVGKTFVAISFIFRNPHPQNEDKEINVFQAYNVAAV
jgi:hypothetical protein